MAIMPEGPAKPITFVLTPAQRARLKKKGLRNKGGVVLRAKFQNGRLVVTHHRLANGKFVSSNAAFA
jgi:hypothetical protein